MDKYIGKRLDGRYEIREIIGVGGMAYVYKAYDNIDDRIVAVKILKDEYLTNEEFTRRFKNESKAIAILSHPNIVKVYDVSFGEKLQYIVMECIDGITLKEYIDQQKEFKWKEAVHFTVQILRALQHAHDKGIVHRDIKPQNIMLLPDGTIKVADFGIARFARQDIRATRSSDKAIGSVHYISPEQARGEITDEKADIYSVGVMLYEMLTGQLPFEADSAVSVAIMQLQSEAKPLREIDPSIPEGLEEITLKAMQKDPSKRYQSAAEFLNDIDEFKKNPSIHFQYKYFVDDSPTRYMETVTKVKNMPDRISAEEEETENDQKPFPIIPVLCAVAAAVVIVGGVFLWMVFGGLLTGNTGSDVTVPNFVGMTLEEISANEEYRENFTITTKEEFNDAPKGTVIGQSISANHTVKKGTKTIQLTVSKGSHMVTVPAVVGQRSDQAEATLKNAGFVVKFLTETSEEVPANYVISVSPAQYPDQILYGSELTLVVSNGTEPVEPVAVPDVLNISKEQAVKMLTDAGFIVDESKITYVNVNKDKPVPKGTVVKQSVTGETQPGTEVVLTLASGYKDVQVQIPLPDSPIAIDLQIYVNGNRKESVEGILPNVVKMKSITVSENSFTMNKEVSSYSVIVKMAKSGTGNFLDYAKYTVDGVNGKATLDSIDDNILGTSSQGE